MSNSIEQMQLDRQEAMGNTPTANMQQAGGPQNGVFQVPKFLHSNNNNNNNCNNSNNCNTASATPMDEPLTTGEPPLYEGGELVGDSGYIYQSNDIMHSATNPLYEGAMLDSSNGNYSSAWRETTFGSHLPQQPRSFGEGGSSLRNNNNNNNNKREFIPYGIPASRKFVTMLFLLVLCVAVAALALAVVALSKSNSNGSGGTPTPSTGASSSSSAVSVADLALLNTTLSTLLVQTNATLTAQLNALQTIVVATNATVVAGTLDTLQQSMASLRAQQTALNNTVTAMNANQTRVSSLLSDNIASLASQTVFNFSTIATSMTTQLTSLQSQTVSNISTLSTSLTSLQVQTVSNISALSTSMATQLTSLQAQTVSNISTLSTSMATQLTSLQAQTVSNFSTLSTSLTSVQAQTVANISALSTSMTTQFTSLQAQTVSNISTLSTSMNTQLTSLQAQTVANISTLSTSVNTQLTSLQAQTVGNFSTLSTSTTTQLTSLQSQTLFNISNLSNQLTSLQSQTVSNTNISTSVNTQLTALQANLTATRNLVCATTSDYTTMPMNQGIATTGANGVKYIEINGSSFLAIANHYDGTSYTTSSPVFRADPVTQQFQLFQTLPCNGGHDVEAFTIGATSFLIYACYTSGSGTVHNINSPLYRFDATLNQFVVHQNIATTGAMGVKYFTIGNLSFLAVANYYDDINAGNLAQSRVYLYNPLTQLFGSFQNFSSTGAWGVDAFTQNGDTYLAFTFYYYLGSYYLNSPVYKFNATLNQFVLFQSIPTIGAFFPCFFVAPTTGEFFLGYSQIYNGSTYLTRSPVYRFDNITVRFVLFQSLPTNGGADGLKSFVTDGTLYYVVSNFYNSATNSYALNSQVFRYNPSLQLFVLVQQVPVMGGSDCDFFVMNGAGYIAFASYIGSSYQTTSPIYKFLTCSSP